VENTTEAAEICALGSRHDSTEGVVEELDCANVQKQDGENTGSGSAAHTGASSLDEDEKRYPGN
jgi:hypothetical protein